MSVCVFIISLIAASDQSCYSTMASAEEILQCLSKPWKSLMLDPVGQAFLFVPRGRILCR